MPAVTFLRKLLDCSCQSIHAGRLSALMSGVTGLLAGHRLSIAGLGRALKSSARVKHNIKRMDRLAGNAHLHAERLPIYQALARGLLGTRPQPVMVVDWSDARSDRALQLLRASVVVDGRSHTLYEEIHPLSKYDNRRVRQQFLERLGTCLPVGCRPILITDAGFRVSWVQQVEAMGWAWLGRVRGRSHYRLNDNARWQPIRALYSEARVKPQFLGTAELTQHHPHRCQLYLVRQRKQGRQDKTIYGRAAQGTSSRACARRHTEPWLLATSLKGVAATRICKLYRQRSQIEGTFRDLKCAQWGLHLRAHRTRCPQRLAVLVLSGTLAAFVAWLTGLAGTTLALEREHQANTVTQRRVLSFVYLGLQLLWHADARITYDRIRQAFSRLKAIIADNAYA